MSPVIEKVTAFITRSGPDGSQLLLFQHPSAGIQIPAGTVEAGETPLDAARREAEEETGLKDLVLRRSLGSTIETLPDGQRVICETTRVYSHPNLTSFDWAVLRRGLSVIVERQAAGFTQVTYAEADRLDNPQYITYQITGWVPDRCLAEMHKRYYFRFEYEGPQTQPWWVETDGHRFHLFWAPLKHLPAIVPPQAGWLGFYED